ncbi:putative Oligopeptide transporter [Melia azedarach]|uniref:Oligopeptide transporter n=1 Tax=Melia azedarach TaxID=155640 RepID=A0ACC1YNH3_MELAZ|nr:putative Oligopeptide transporter [Melia azedarach]
MWWPANLVQVSIFRALHEKAKRKNGGLTRLKFLLTIFTSSFTYYIVPGYLFPSLSALSFIYWIWEDSITVQRLGSGLYDIGIGSFRDWFTVAGFLGSPLPSPLFTIVNPLFGIGTYSFMFFSPIAYWSNAYEATRFPLFSSHTFDYAAKTYNITLILKRETFNLDQVAYDL